MNDILLSWDRDWHGDGGWGGPWWGLSLLLLLVVVGGIVIYLLRRRPAPISSDDAGSAQADAEQVLATRFARGDIDEDEYRARRSVLREDG